MASRVEVKFGASVGELKSAVDDVNSSLDSIRSHVEGVSQGFAALAGLAGAALSFEGLKSAFNDLASFADQIQNAQARMGGTLEEMTTLSGIAALTGVSFQSLERAVEAANLQVQKGTADAYGPAAQGLKSLGLTASELTNLPVDQWFAKVSDAVSRFNPSLTLTSNVQQAFGRGMAELMPLLLQGSDHFDEMRDAVQQAQAGLSAALPGISDTEEKLNLLSLRSRAFAAQVFTTLKPAIDFAIDSFSRLTASISADTIRDAANTIANGLIEIAATVARFFVQAGVSVDALKAKLDFRPDLNLGEIEADSPIMKLLSTMAKVTGQYDKLKETLSHPISLDFNPVASFADRFGGSSVDDQLKSIETAAKRAHDAVNTAIPTSGSWGAVAQDLARVNSETLDVAASFTKLNAVAADNDIKNRVATELEAINTEIAGAQRSYQSQVEKINSLSATFQLTEDQKTAALLAALDARHAAEMVALAQESEIRGLSVQQTQKMLDEQEKLDQKYAADRQKIMDQAFQADVRSWTNVLQPIQSAWDSQLRGLLAGTTSWSQAMRSIFSSLALDVVKELEKVALQKAAVGLATSFGAGPQSMLGGLFGAGNAAAQTANTSALGALTFAVSANTVALGGETVATTSAAAADAAGGAGGIAGLFKTFMEFLPAFDTGSWSLPATTMAVVHQGEMIVPAGPAAGLRQALTSGGGAGGLNANINISGFTGTQAMINQIIPQLARQLSAYRNLNPSVA